MEDGLTPAQQDAQAEPTNAEETIGVDALEQVARAADSNSSRTRHRKSREGEVAAPNKQLYIGNLYYEVTGEQLKKVFSKFGEVASVRIVYDNRGLSRGFGYVEFANIEDAQTAVENLDMQVFEGRNLVVQFHRARTGPGRDANGGQEHRTRRPRLCSSETCPLRCLTRT